MKGDFTRSSFDPRKHYSRVLMQQGRVSLDADANEESSILLHHLRALTRDLFGAFGGPADGGGFNLAVDSSHHPPRLVIGAGHYYVDGILCEADADCDYASQPDYLPVVPDDMQKGDPLLVWLDEPDADRRFWLYLDVWERHITWIEDDHIREPALGGPDTCTRAKVIWQVKALPWDPAWNPAAGASPCQIPLKTLHGLGDAHMAARLDPGAQVADPCVISPHASYRGAENQLYRVEIHRGGHTPSATFKWSRDNGSVATRWLGTEGDDLIAKNGRGFGAGDWIELSHDALDLAGVPGQLVRLARVDADRLTIDSATVPSNGLMAWSETLSNPKLRRWDQRGNDDVALVDGAMPLAERSATAPNWIALEDGVQIQFAEGGEYRTGDYWLIPARVATQDIEWPRDAAGHGLLLSPWGIAHHYAPLGIVSLNAEKVVVEPCRRCIEIPAVPCRAAAANRVMIAPRPIPAAPAPAPAADGGHAKPKGKRASKPK